MHARIWYEPDGVVRITTFAPGIGDDDKLRACSTLINDKRIHTQATWEDAESLEHLRALLPASRKFRDCWRQAPRGGVMVDLVRARTQRLVEIRAERDAALAATDGLMLRAQETGQDTTQLLAERQRLRDLPAKAQADLDAFTTAEELEAYEVIR